VTGIEYFGIASGGIKYINDSFVGGNEGLGAIKL